MPNNMGVAAGWGKMKGLGDIFLKREKGKIAYITVSNALQ